MAVDRARRDEQPLSDLTVAHPFGYQLGDRAL
jgi:hypothetical protein